MGSSGRYRGLLAASRKSVAMMRAVTCAFRGVKYLKSQEALADVSKEDGDWNWALMGPDPEWLPLCGGGPGSMEEMRGIIGKTMFCYGLLRLTFGTGSERKTKYIYVQALNMDDNTSGEEVSQSERGQAAAKAPLMKKVIEKYVTISASWHINGAADCTLATVFDVLRKADGGDADFYTQEKYEEAMEEFRLTHADTIKEEKKVDDLAIQMKKEHAPQKSDVVDVPQEAQAERNPNQDEVVRCRSATPSYRVGDAVMVLKDGVWLDDGTVVERAKEAGLRDGFRVEAGSIKAVYNHHNSFKWFSVGLSSRDLKLSLRPKPPDPKLGSLLKETHNFFSRWNVRYFEARKGFLLWWSTVQDAKAGKKPNGTMALMNLKVQLQGQEFSFVCANSKGMIYSFRAISVPVAEIWYKKLKEHGEYAEEMGAYMRAMKAREQEQLE